MKARFLTFDRLEQRRAGSGHATQRVEQAHDLL
jgi:hypothetical protein